MNLDPLTADRIRALRQSASLFRQMAREARRGKRNQDFIDYMLQADRNETNARNLEKDMHS
jgi:hypothetical protein